MHRGAARSASLMAGSHLGTSAAWLKWCLGISSWEHLARGLPTHPGGCNNSTWRMYVCAPLCTRMHRGAARSASLMAGSHLGISAASLKWCLGTFSWEHLSRGLPTHPGDVMIRPGVCNACAPLYADGIEVRRVHPL